MQEQTDIRVFIADDHPTTISQLTQFINAAPGMKVVGTAMDGASVNHYFSNGHNGVDVALIDIGMPKMNGLRATGLIKEACKQKLKVIVVTGLNGEIFPAEAIKNHADGFIAKSRRKAEFIDAIKRVHKGELVILPELEDDPEDTLDNFTDIPHPAPNLNSGAQQVELSPMEIRIIRHTVKEGLTSKEIAGIMKMGTPNIDKIKHNIFIKLEVKNAAQLGARAQELGLLD